MNLQSATQIFSGLPSDWIVIACLAVLLVGFTIMRGTALATALSLSLPTSMALFALMPKAIFIGALAKQFQTGLPQALIFLCIEVLMFLLFTRIVALIAESSSLTASFIAGLAATIVVICIWVQVPSLSGIWHFSSQTESLFGAAYAFWWLLAAYAGIAFARS